MKLCKDCKFFNRAVLHGLCSRNAYTSDPDPVDGSTHTVGSRLASIERREATFIFTTRCGPKGRHFQPRGQV